MLLRIPIGDPKLDFLTGWFIIHLVTTLFVRGSLYQFLRPFEIMRCGATRDPFAISAVPNGDDELVRAIRLCVGGPAPVTVSSRMSGGSPSPLLLYDTVGLMHDEVRRDCHANEVQAIEKLDVLIG